LVLLTIVVDMLSLAGRAAGKTPPQFDDLGLEDLEAG